jgi:exopolysaccharide biosynthesis polyprenyl glycosylphosphotransferase
MIEAPISPSRQHSEEKLFVSYDTGIAGWTDARRILSRFLVLCGDLMVVFAAYVVAFAVRFGSETFLSVFPATKGVPHLHEYALAAPIVLFMWAFALSRQGSYKRIHLPALDDGIRLFRVALMGTVFSMSAMFLYRDVSFSRLVFFLGGVLAFAGLYAYRQVLKIAYISWVQSNKRPKRVLIMGSGYLATSLKKILEKQGDSAILSSRELDVASIRRTIVRSRINEVLLAHPSMTHKDTVMLAGFCEERHVTFRLIPDILEIRMGEVLIDESLGVPTFQIKPVSLQGTAFLTKRIMDVTCASIALGVCAVPLLVIAAIIKLTSNGSVLYKHERVGFRGRPFQFMKFRTMVSNADDLLKALIEKSDRKGPVFKMKKDPRVTWIGKFLRRYSLDEVPQLLNVLRGEMSLAGPRPQVLWEAKHYDEWARKRLNVLPGITGLWQVSGRAELTYEQMIELDIYYIEHWSPGLDVKILLKTIPAVLSAKGAY